MLSGEKIYLRLLNIQDATMEYVTWMNDYEIVKFTESQLCNKTIGTIESYIKDVSNDKNYAFAIIDKITDKHIGNVKIGSINWIHRSADIGIIIGSKNYHGKGIGVEAYKLALDYAFYHLNLRRIVAGAVALNEASMRLHEAAGFQMLYEEKEAYYFEGQYVSVMHYAITKEMFENKFGI